MKDKEIALTEHLNELRSRILKSIIFIIVSSCVVYRFSGTIIGKIAGPVEKLVFIAPQEAFVANIKIALFGGLFLASPIVLYQIWRFVSAGLKKNEVKHVMIFGPLSFIFFLAGIFFGYFIIVPIGIKFLLGFATETVAPMITISKYISFISGLTLTFGMIFELPLVSLFLTKIHIVTPHFLIKKRRHAIVFIFVIAAILTPPDVVTQCLMAGPLLVLYEIGILFSKFAYRPV